MVANTQREMARTRALLTQREREVLAGDEGDSDDLRFVKWEIKNRIKDEIPQDVAVLADHYPEALAALRSEVCDTGSGD